MAKVIPDRFAVMAVDPGGTTGVCQGLFAPVRCEPLSVKGLFDRAQEKNAVRWSEITADPAKTAQWIEGFWKRFLAKWVEQELPASHCYLVVENFALRQRSVDLAPVEIRAGLKTLGVLFEDQSPSEAKGYATNDRLRSWGIWAVGQEHSRDALRHLATKVAKVIE